MLDPIALAHEIMSDSAKSGKSLLLCTNNLSLQDIILLMNVLIIRYGLICSIHKIGKIQYRIYINAKSKNKLREIVMPYIVPSMLYKLDL